LKTRAKARTTEAIPSRLDYDRSKLKGEKLGTEIAADIHVRSIFNIQDLDIRAVPISIFETGSAPFVASSPLLVRWICSKGVTIVTGIE
jgi:hypothetical protein